MRYTSFGIEDNFLILDFFYNAGGNERQAWTDETNHRNCHQSTQTEALQIQYKKKKANHWSVHARIKTTSETNLSYFGGLPNEKKKKKA